MIIYMYTGIHDSMHSYEAFFLLFVLGLVGALDNSTTLARSRNEVNPPSLRSEAMYTGQAVGFKVTKYTHTQTGICLRIESFFLPSINQQSFLVRLRDHQRIWHKVHRHPPHTPPHLGYK